MCLLSSFNLLTSAHSGLGACRAPVSPPVGAALNVPGWIAERTASETLILLRIVRGEYTRAYCGSMCEWLRVRRTRRTEIRQSGRDRESVWCGSNRQSLQASVSRQICRSFFFPSSKISRCFKGWSHRSVCLRGVYVTLGQRPSHIHFGSTLTLTVTLKVPPVIVWHFEWRLYRLRGRSLLWF